jgi:two-component system alkaline phosphatase synthesis response regulator PhoP
MSATPEAKHVLVVDDERDIVELIRYNLTKEGYEVATAYNGKEALALAGSGTALVILDLMMPVLDGFATCRKLKGTPATAGIPVIFLTASSSEVDEVEGLELGADDYIQKPISPRKLVARVKAVLRRREQSGDESNEPPTIHQGRLTIDRRSFTVRIADRDVFFPRKEFEILALLAAHPGKVFTREMLLNAIWGSQVIVVDRTVDVHIRKVREKLGDDADVIETIKGVGYRFKA